MKKALVILMALAMVFAVYADDLAAVTAAFNQDYAKAQSFAGGAVYAFGGSAATVTDYIAGDSDGNCTNGTIDLTATIHF